MAEQIAFDQALSFWQDGHICYYSQHNKENS